MFTGIIQELGRVKSTVRHDNLKLDIESKRMPKTLEIGDSVAINGVCQTIIEIGRGLFSVEAIEETLGRTTLGDLRQGDQVNLESPMATGDMFHGHMVQGHIDCVGRIISISRDKGSQIMTIGFPGRFEGYLIEKGSIAVDGISLTVANIEDGSFSIALIPHTIQNTTLNLKKAGDGVNLEFDMIAKYIERMTSNSEKEDLTINYLKEHGFG